MAYKLEISEKSSTSGRFIMSALEELQQAYVDSGLKQYQLAEKLGVSRAYVSAILNGRKNLTLRVLAEFSWALGVKPDVKLKRK